MGCIFAALRVKNAHSELRERNLQLEAMLHQVEALAITDPLTGLFNRRRFGDVLKREFAVTKRYRNTLSCLLLDLDHFKVVNDQLGHPVGDRTLRETAAIMRRSCRASDLVARIGGEEFALILPGRDRAAAAQFCELLRAVVANHDWSEIGTALAITVSVGVAQWDGTSEVDELLHQADSQLYRAKRAGRNQVA